MQGNGDKQSSVSDRFNSEERPKYVLDWDDSIQHNGKNLYRIIYRDGSKGGWIQGYHNLSQYGDCKVDDDAKVFGAGYVHGDAQVYGNAQVYERAWVFDKAIVHSDAQVYGDSQVYGKSEITDSARVYGQAEVYGRDITILVDGDCEVCGETILTEPEDSQNSDSSSDEQEAMPDDSEAIKQRFIPSSNFPDWECHPDSVAYSPYRRCLVEILRDKDEDTCFFLVGIWYASGKVFYGSPSYKMDDAFWELVGKVLAILNENRYEIPPYVLNGCPLLNEFYIDNDHIVDNITLASELRELGIQEH